MPARQPEERTRTALLEPRELAPPAALPARPSPAPVSAHRFGEVLVRPDARDLPPPAASHEQAPVTRASEVTGAVAGGLLGAGAGALIGGMLGGPVGAVAGAIVGGLAGALVGAALGRSGPLANATVRAAMRSAWTASDAGSAANRHEEGGYIVRRADGSLGVERWPSGGGASITPPARAADGTYNGHTVLGEFHTHPNPPVDESGRTWVQGPHPGDTNAIRAEGYPGDSYIISADTVYVVHPDGTSGVVGSRADVLGR